MSEEPFYAPNRTIAPRQPRVGEHLWAIGKNGRQLDCELRDHGEWGVEVQILSRAGISLWPALADPRVSARGSQPAEGAALPRGRCPHRVPSTPMSFFTRPA